MRQQRGAHPEGSFVISWREGGKLRRESAGKHGADAEAARQRKEALLRARANGVTVVVQRCFGAMCDAADMMVLQGAKLARA